MIVRALDLDTSNCPNPNINDVSKESNGYDVIATVIDEGIFFGDNGSFNPNNFLTRAQMAAVLNRAFQLEDINKKLSFKVMNSLHWAHDDIQLLAANNITVGFKDNTFRPGQTITRAEFSAFMARVLKLENKNNEKTTKHLK